MAYEPGEVTPASTDPAAASYPQGTSSDEIRQDIRRTRSDMDETVDALEERLRPRHLIDDFLEWFRSGGASKASGAAGSAASSAKESVQDYGSKIIDKLKAHPMPAALIGAGLVWLLFEDDDKVSRRDYEPRKWDVPDYSGSYVDARTGQPYSASYGAEAAGTVRAGAMMPPGAGGEQQEQRPSLVERAKDGLSGAAERVKGAAQSAGETARHAGDRVGEWAGSARGYASATASSARDYASYASEQASRGYETGKHYLERGMNEYPLAVGAAAMALGVLGGLILPHTKTEDKWLGERSDDLKDRAKEMGRDAAERGMHVAAATANAASEEVQRQGLTPGQIGEKAKHVAQNVKEAASDSARREGIDPGSIAHKGKEVLERTKETAKEETRRQKDQFHA